MKVGSALVLLCLACPGAPLGASGLDLDGYLGQVRRGNQSLLGARAEDAALALSARRPLAAYSPTLTGQVQNQNDQQIPLGASALSPIETQSLSWDTNLSKLFSTGTKVGLDYSGDNTAMMFSALPPVLAAQAQAFGSLLPPNGFVTGQQLTLSVTQPLWRNFMGAQVQAGVSKASAQADAARATNLYAAQAVLFQARRAYVELATVRSVTGILKASLERNRKILDWTKRRWSENLADRVDVLEGEAALRQVALNLAQNAQDEADAAAVFNALRGMTPTAAVPDLEPPMAPAALPAPAGDRLDLRAAEAALRTSDAEVRDVTQSFTPDLSVFADLGYGERPIDALPAGLQGPRPDTVVGLKFTANLDAVLYHEVLKGARRARGYGRAVVEQKRLEIAKDWAELRRDFAGVGERLRLARELRALQKLKADREKVRYEHGRTTNYQVLRFQDDYNLSRIQVLRLTAQAEELWAQARYYNGQDRPW